MRRDGRGAVALVVIAITLFFTSRPAWAESHVNELDFFTRSNLLRVSKGLTPLVVDLQMTDVARYWSSRMAAAGDISHNPDLKDQIANWKMVGENVGMGPNVAAIEAAFEASPHHYENLVNPNYQFVGIGVVEAGSTIFVTVDFKRASNALSVGLPAPISPAPSPSPKPPPPAATAKAPAPVRAPSTPVAAAPAPVVQGVTSPDGSAVPAATDAGANTSLAADLKAPPQMPDVLGFGRGPLKSLATAARSSIRIPRALTGPTARIAWAFVLGIIASQMLVVRKSGRWPRFPGRRQHTPAHVT